MKFEFVLFIKLLVACALLVVAVAIPEWYGGDLFNSYYESRSTFVAVGVIICAGVACLFVVLILDLVSLIGKGQLHGALGLARHILLLSGTTLLILALIIYVVKVQQQWSYVLSVCATMLVSELALYTVCGCVGVK
ncbi:unnamed protein product [Dicrocoelium dendriticum]|nr:unnamed protein product [Dicrocoelium dendriticum]